MKNLSFVLLFALALAGCDEEDNAFVGTGGSGGSGGSGNANQTVTEDFSNLTLKSDIPTEIARLSDPGNQPLSVFQRIFTDDSNSEIAYVGQGGTDSDSYIYRAATSGQTELGTTDATFNRRLYAMSGDGSTFVHVKNNNEIFVVNPATQVSTQIGTGLSLTGVIEHIATPDDGSVVAFISNQDLAGNNGSNVLQIFTLTTDGSDTVTQVSRFAADIFTTSTSQLAFTGNGNLILFHSTQDLDTSTPGKNADNSDEVFSITNSDGGTIRQLSNINASGTITVMKSSDDGSIVAFLIDNQLFVYDSLTAIASGFGALVSTLAGDVTAIDGDSEDQFDISADGSIVAYLNDTGDNFHRLYTGSADSTGVTEHFSTNANIQSPHLTAGDTVATFISNGNFGLGGANAYQVYELDF